MDNTPVYIGLAELAKSWARFLSLKYFLTNDWYVISKSLIKTTFPIETGKLSTYPIYPSLPYSLRIMEIFWNFLIGEAISWDWSFNYFPDLLYLKLETLKTKNKLTQNKFCHVFKKEREYCKIMLEISWFQMNEWKIKWKHLQIIIWANKSLRFQFIFYLVKHGEILFLKQIQWN